MTTETRVLAGDAVGVYSRHLSLPPKFVRQVIAQLKSRGRVAAARPVSPDHTPRAIARTILALTSPTIRDAVETEERLGALSLTVGNGQPCLEDQLTDMAEEAVGWRYGDTRFRDGHVIIGHDTEAALLDSATYLGAKDPDLGGLRRFTVVTNRAIAQIARELLPTRREAV